MHGLSADEKLQPVVSNEWFRKNRTKIFEAFGMKDCKTFISHNLKLNCSEDKMGKLQTERSVAILPMECNDQPVKLDEIRIISIDINDSDLVHGYL